ncbi:MAG: ABC transporter substrate-binding protein [Bordetella sp.]|uniref:ABC transporter substrate-binding protein n=1 Tax=Bordetella sp. TaxID=28081 RepID=UPI003F7BB97A
MRVISWIRLRPLRLAVPLIALALLAAAGAQALRPVDVKTLFSAARQRGQLIVGVPYLAPPQAAGAKVRTPERLDPQMAQRLARRLGLPVVLRQVDAAQAPALLASGAVDLVLADEADTAADAAPPSGIERVPTGYATRPQAVIRDDTAMRRWSDVAGHTACMSDAAAAAQALARRWGAKVRLYRVPSDALVAVREGQCDLGLVDDTVWTPLMGYPEWKKYAATLPLEESAAAHVWLLRGQPEAGWLAGEMRHWRGEGAWRKMTAQWARNVAFDVYLDQSVPDCHG